MNNPTSQDQEEFQLLLKRVKSGDKQAMEQILIEFEQPIKQMSRFIKMPTEDTIQEIKTTLLEKLLSK